MLLTPDEKLLHSIFQAGLQGFFDARRAGVNAAVLFEEARPIWLLMEELAKLNRLPSLTEVHLKTGIQIDEICKDPIDVGLASSYIVRRGLSGQLNEKLAGLFRDDAVNKDPFAVRNRLVDVYQQTSWGLGQPLSINSRDAIEQFKRAYGRAASAAGGLLGMSSPWPTVDSASLGLQPGELTVVFAKRKLGKTIERRTIVHDPVTGHEQTIEELVRGEKGQVLTWQQSGPITTAKPTAYMDCGEKECFKITWRSGREIIAAPTHPFLTPRGYVRLDELKVGHHTAAVKKLPEPLKPQAMYDDEVRLLAYMIADGGLTQGTPTYTKYDEALVGDLRASVEALGCQLVSHPKRGVYSITKHNGERNHVTALLDAWGVMGKKSVDKMVPKEVFSLDNEQLGLFLGRLWSGDGTVQADGRVSYSTGSHKMALQIQHLLLRFGIASRVRSVERDTDHGTYYEVGIHREDIAAFKTHVKLVGEKASKLSDVTFEGRSRVGWIKNEEMSELIGSEMNARPELLKAVGEELGYEFGFQKGHVYDAKSGRIRRHVFRAFCDVYDSPLKWVLDENIWWDEIESIEPAGKHHCYDLTVEPTSCYVANDYIVHNSWIVIVWGVHMWRKDLKPGEKILFVTMEMTELQIMRRMACVDLRLPWDDLRKGKLTMHQKNLLDEWCEQRVSEEGDPTKSNIIFATSKECRDAKDIGALVAEHRPKCVIVDSFYILGRETNKSIYERVLGNVQALKLDVALQYNIPVLASTQLKGTVGKDTLNADSDDAMGAKAIGDYADVTRGLFADEELWAASKRYWRGMEAREFKPKDVEINFNFETMDFSEVREILPEDEKAEKEEREEKEGKTVKRPRGGRTNKPTDEELARAADVEAPLDPSQDLTV